MATIPASRPDGVGLRALGEQYDAVGIAFTKE